MVLRLASGAIAPPPVPSAEAFDAARLRHDAVPASPLLRRLLHVLCALVAGIAVWVHTGRLDIVAVADGRLVPRTRLKIVQPADGGVVREVLVDEGAEVVGGEVLVRLDPALAQAELRALATELAQRMLQLRRIDAELDDAPLTRHAGDDDDAFARAEAQWRANRSAWHDARGQEAAALGAGRARARGGNDAGRQSSSARCRSTAPPPSATRGSPPKASSASCSRSSASASASSASTTSPPSGTSPPR